MSETEARDEKTGAFLPGNQVAVKHGGHAFLITGKAPSVRGARVQNKIIIHKYMIRPLLSLERLSFDKKEGKICYRYGKEAEEVERMDYLELIARVTSHIPDKGQVTIRYFGLYANAHRGKVRKSEEAAGKLIIIEEECPRIPRRGWAAKWAGRVSFPWTS
jgi:hypothetical protein